VALLGDAKVSEGEDMHLLQFVEPAPNQFQFR